MDSRQQHLDVMCFPFLFPNGKFRKYDKREKEISHSEYIKSRLLTKIHVSENTRSTAVSVHGTSQYCGKKSLESLPLVCTMCYNLK